MAPTRSRRSRPPKGSARTSWTSWDGAVIREELFGPERLEQHAESLAAAHFVERRKSRVNPLDERLRANEAALAAAYDLVAAQATAQTAITPAAQWFVDNYYVVEEQIRSTRRDLPRRFYEQLPKLANGPFVQLPQVFSIAWAFVAHTDSRFDLTALERYIAAFQRVRPLEIGELWAVAITLRIVLVENLRRTVDRVVAATEERRLADEAADRLLGKGVDPPEAIDVVMRPYLHAPLPSAFTVQLVRRLHDLDPEVTPARRWLETRLAAQGTTPDALVHDDHYRQAAMNVTVGNIITSMRRISQVDWSTSIERMSLVDALLSGASDFAAMDFATRDRYRRATEILARGSRRSELEVAERALTASRAAEGGSSAPASHDSRRRDPGYFLIGEGRPAFEAELGFVEPRRHMRGRFARLDLRGYLGLLGLQTALLLTLPLLLLGFLGVPAGLLVALGLLALLPATDMAVVLLNHAATTRFDVRTLPALELAKGVPAELRTLIVLPTMLRDEASLAGQLQRLEIHFLANADEELRFALLTDWEDAPLESTEADYAILRAAEAGIEALNRRHGAASGGTRFTLLHRRRQWSETQSAWIGWERKRGKLHELNRLLRAEADTSFTTSDGGYPIAPEGVRYVITLDDDTRTPRGTARRLIGKMAHPLNRPRLDEVSGRVVEGYGVLQPRVTLALPGDGEGSIFQRIFSGALGIDPYVSAVSDVYQDLFGEGSYTGKGIYDVDVFMAALDGRVPDETLLSHDLFEGTYARAGLVSDIEVIEEFPTRFEVASGRNHRWARGDLQLLPWILGSAHRVAAASERRGTPRATRRDALPAIGRWKMIDNLRRALLPPTTVAALLVGWSALPPTAAALWTAFMLAPLAMPTLVPLVASLIPRRGGTSLRHHLRMLLSDLKLAAAQFALAVSFMAHEAMSMTDAIARTVLRLFVTRRRLLEWVTAGHAARGGTPTIGAYVTLMGPSVVVAVGAATLLIGGGAPAWPLALPFLLVWAMAPLIARIVSMPSPDAGRPSFSADDEIALRAVARRTWRYFETFVTPLEHMLPPDNVQEDPATVVAHRTSPTNIGLYLLTVSTARDFGWIGTTEMVERLEATLETMERMPRYRGHFSNWYDTRDLRILEPNYVSSVDSGNLCGHLITVSQACRERLGDLSLTPMVFEGIRDAVALLQGHVKTMLATLDRSARRSSGGLGSSLARLAEAVVSLDADLREAREDDDVDVPSTLADVASAARGVLDLARRTAEEHPAHASELLAWAEAALGTVDSHARDLELVSDEAGDAASSLADPTDRSAAARELRRRLEAVAATARRFADEMDFSFLVSEERKLLSIGYLVSDGTLDPSCYDLLATEARLASFVAIAKGDAPAKHWFRLGRGLTPVELDGALTSWSGSMFEYLMPSLVMREPAGSLLGHTNRLVVRRQMQYAAEHGVPWGISESAYNARDLHLNYQYSAFGVPDLALKRGLASQLVIAPYATALAAMIDPPSAVRNFAQLERAGALGAHGYYEALDYTPSRLVEGRPVAIVRAFMAHHQGMTIVAIANTILSGLVRARFHADTTVQATELVLQERVPRSAEATHRRRPAVEYGNGVGERSQPQVRYLNTPHDAAPQTHVLSNGRYTVMLTGSGSGYSAWNSLAITRWREDPTRDDHGSYLYLRDVGSGAVWSAGFQPTGADPERYRVEFQEDRARVVRTDAGITSTLDVLVSAEEDAEVRRITLSNKGLRTREIDVTSYAELVLGPAAADAAHPAFSKLFVQTEFDANTGALLATRRRRAPDEPEIWVAHLCVVEGVAVGEREYETDRARFLGRGRGVRSPAAVRTGRSLSNTVGTVLDPIFSLRHRLRLAPGTSGRIAFWTMVASSREAALDLVDAHRDASAFDRAATLAWTHAQVQLRHLRIDHAEAALFQRLASHVIYSGTTLRPSSVVLRRAIGGAEGLWPHAISGDLPIVLLSIGGEGELPLVRQVLRAHEFWSAKGLHVDVVIVNEQATSYLQELHATVETLARARAPRGTSAGRQGGIFVLRGDQISLETRDLLRSAARAVLLGRRGLLEDQLYRLRLERPAPKPVAEPAAPARVASVHVPPLVLENGMGGFTEDGREYVTLLTGDAWTPAPWINVVANPTFGFQVAAEGGGHTWALNARERHLSPWTNDPVSNVSGEALYLRDEATGALWSPTATPIRHASPYVARHGFGYSIFEHASHGIHCELLQLVPLTDPVKVSRLRLRNVSGTRRRLSVTGYVEWVLGPSRPATAHHVETSIDAATGVMLARNHWHTAFGERVAFFDLGGRQTTWTGDRTEFIGRNRTLRQPAALDHGIDLSKTIGAGLDPCGALQTRVDLEVGEEVEIVVLLGETGTAAEAREIVRRYRAVEVDELLADVRTHWEGVLEGVRVRTPDEALDVMLNGWLLYQTLACRVWARAGFYQASGAYGFRDQLQDGMALASTRPDLTREHLLRAAARQFVEGDVQHWWLPHSGQGVRTRISDGRVWLAFTLAHYLDVTDDRAVLDEELPFLAGPALEPGQHDAFFLPTVLDEPASLYEHAARALDRSLATGAHGLPLIGTGDWNDGMNRVGEDDRGESVWLGWFLAASLAAFLPIAGARGDDERVRRWRSHLQTLRASLDRDAWDGAWYRRAYFDDGTPLGSASSLECRIDAIAQSWGVISGFAPEERARTAMAEVDAQLVDRELGLARLFTPPFDETPLDPGYIKGYPPGLRENGGQYTHAAIWNVIAFALLGDGDRTGELLAMINPVTHSKTPEDVERYKVEPYVVAADVYTAPGHVGRGGWTWYTGSAAWMQRAGVEYLLGLRLRGTSLLLDPCIPRAWPGFELRYRHMGRTIYLITVENPEAVSRGIGSASLDGVSIDERPLRVDLVDDGGTHRLHVVLG
ncbi:MAG: glycosyl transferase [Trueperaceae bacterium]|nr:glycosyl transferase [Trueperaceae bacterium]